MVWVIGWDYAGSFFKEIRSGAKVVGAVSTRFVLWMLKWHLYLFRNLKTKVKSGHLEHSLVFWLHLLVSGEIIFKWNVYSHILLPLMTDTLILVTWDSKCCTVRYTVVDVQHFWEEDKLRQHKYNSNYQSGSFRPEVEGHSRI